MAVVIIFIISISLAVLMVAAMLDTLRMAMMSMPKRAMLFRRADPPACQ